MQFNTLILALTLCLAGCATSIKQGVYIDKNGKVTEDKLRFKDANKVMYLPY